LRSLREIFENHNGRLLNKWNHYIDIYEKYLNKFRGTDFVFLEIGTAHGGSLQMWREYFVDQAIIIGVDVNPECKKFEEGNTKIFIGSQEDESFLNDLKRKIPKVDVLLDDGGHTMKQQITTFNSLFDHVKEDGLYMCEDTHTSYRKDYHGGYKSAKSFIEFSKNMIDYIHGWHATGSMKNKIYNSYTQSIHGVYFYDSIVIFEKKKVTKPHNTFKGEKQLSNHFTDFGQKKKISKKIKLLLGMHKPTN